jgi:exosortase
MRKGVLLIIGDYKLLVADACSGMRSIINLMALIILYVYLQKVSISRRVIILASIIPIALMANTVRVTALALITFHYGDAAGQSFYHNISGFVVFAIALASVVFLDKLLQVFHKTRKEAVT